MPLRRPPTSPGSSGSSLVLGWIAYFFVNRSESKAEIGSEIELAPNRKPYYDDEELEGPRLMRVQFLAVILLATMVVGLPLYWILEPGRQAAKVRSWDKQFATWGSHLFAPTADGGFNCAGCHGGMTATGGVAEFVVTDPLTSDVQAVSWKAPALNTVLYRFDASEVTFIITYGRPGTPMSAWGVEGGGAMNHQQIQTLIEYIKSITVAPEGCTVPDAQGIDLTKKPSTVCDGGHLPTATQEEIQTAAEAAVDDGTSRIARRGAVQPRPGQRRLLLCALPHAGLELRRPRHAGFGQPRLEPHRWRDRGALPEQAGHGRLRQGRQRQRRSLRHPGSGFGEDARLRRDADRRTDQRHRGLREDFVEMTSLATLAIGWMPEIRGLLTVVIAVVVFCGSIYLLLATNVGARLGFLLAIAALAAWMASMGAIWWAYGLGLQGRAPQWSVASGVNLMRSPDQLTNSHITDDLELTLDPAYGTSEAAESARQSLQDAGWNLLGEDDPQRGQAIASADEIVQHEFELYAAGDYVAISVLDRGGERWPNWFGDSLDFFALRHTPHYALVEIAPVVPQRTEPGRAPAAPVIDETQPHQYVLMVRDLGSKRQPATFLTLGASLIFGATCWMLHRRDKTVAKHIAEAKG